METLRQLIESINMEDEKRSAETARFVEEMKIKRALAPGQWQAIKADLREQSEAMLASSPVKIEIEATGIYDFFLRNLRNGKTFSLVYSPNVPCIQYVTPEGKEGHLAFRVSADGTSVQILDEQFPKRSAEVALDILRRLTR